jgi:DNA repair protein RadD
VQTGELFEAGYLAPLDYYQKELIKSRDLKVNTTGADYTVESMEQQYKAAGMAGKVAEYAARILTQKRNLLIFCSTIKAANDTCKLISGSVVVHGKTPDKEREEILTGFKDGLITCVINVGVLTTGFDFPALEAVLIARRTMSLALYYQVVGRVMRRFIYPDGTQKRGLIMDFGSNIARFGKIETMVLKPGGKKGELWAVWNNGRPLTNVLFEGQNNYQTTATCTT